MFFSHLQDLENQLAESHDRVRQLELELEQLRSGKDQDEAETDAGSRGFVILKLILSFESVISECSDERLNVLKKRFFRKVIFSLDFIYFSEKADLKNLEW